MGSSNFVHFKMYKVTFVISLAAIATCGFKIEAVDKMDNCPADKCFGEAPGEITSQGYPQNYPNNVDQTWYIKLPVGNKVSLSFIGIDIEDHGTCRYDSLTIYDGNSANSLELEKLCGTSPPSNIVSSKNEMFIKFKSDDSVQKKGFKIKFDICPADECFATAPVEIISPGYPQKYPNNVDKTWYIKLPVGNKVSLSFIDFDVENENTCSYDSLTIYDGNSADSPELGKYCGTSSSVPSNIVSSKK